MEPSTVSIRQTRLCLPFDSEAHYQDCVEHLTMYRQHIGICNPHSISEK